VTNRHLFTDSSGFDCVATLRREGAVLDERMIDTAVAPGTAEKYSLPFPVPTAPGEYTVDVSFRLRRPTRWAPAGHEVAWGQAVLVVPGATLRRTTSAPELVDGIHNVGVRGEGFTALFSKIYGGLVSYRYGLTPDGGHELLRSIPRPSFWHAPTSNERGGRMPFRDGQWLLASRYPDLDRAVENPEVVVHGDGVDVRYRYVLPTTPTSGCDVTYRVSSDGRVDVTLAVRPGEGLPDMPELGMLLEAPADLHHLRWYGEGPDECYVDRRNGARLGVYSGDVRTQLTPYLHPQEAGSHTGVRWATVTDDHGRGLRLECADGMEFSALPWTPFEIENAAHHVELPPGHHTVLRPALMRRGVGGDNSWGAQTHPEYRLASGGELVFRFAFHGIR
jgi:beta-galactosidase